MVVGLPYQSVEMLENAVNALVQLTPPAENAVHSINEIMPIFRVQDNTESSSILSNAKQQAKGTANTSCTPQGFLLFAYGSTANLARSRLLALDTDTVG